MIESTKLLILIRQAFGDVPFPSHCGIIAAELIDDWINDEDILKEETKKKDFIGSWWDVPEEHIQKGSLGFNYLDALGMEFYLPAFMSFAVKEPVPSIFSILESYLIPYDDDSDENMYELFCERLSKITGQKRDVTILFMRFMIQEIDKFPTINGYKYMDSNDLQKALNHEYWHTYS